MTEKELEKSLRRGLGGAILQLAQSGDKAKYRDTLLRCCLQDITYDWQVEGTKGFYLYSAICALGFEENFEPFIIEKFLSKHTKNSFFYQLSEILFYYADNGSELSKNAFFKKYDYYKSKNTLSNDEYQQWEEIVVRLFYLEGFAAFKRYIVELNKRETDGGDFDWFFIRVNDSFGKKKVQSFFEKNYAESDYIKILINKKNAEQIDLDEKIKQHKANPPTQEKVTLNDLVKAIKAAENEKYPRAKFARAKRYFSRCATSEDIAPLLEYAQSEDTLLSEIAIECLAEFKDKRIHDLAIKLLNKKTKTSALALLIKNYKKTDDELIWKCIKKSNISHDVQMDFRDIYLRNKSKNAFPALHRVYLKGDCGFCRYYIVKAMENCDVLSNELLEECLLDSYDDTRDLAKNIIKKRKKSKDK